MLSQNAAQSIGDVITNGMSLFNVKGFDGEPLDINSAVGGAIKNKLNTIFGESNLKTASDIWMRLNRIHMAVSSVVYSVQGAKNAILEADEITGGHVAKIGNALQDQGIIEDETFDWMNPNPNYQEPFRGLYGKINRLEDIADSTSTFVNAGLEIKEASTELVDSTTELTTATTEFKTAFEELQATERVDSESPLIDRTDLLKDEPTETTT